jgi:valyl-tRNA synthetase
MRAALSVMLRLLAPYLPFVTARRCGRGGRTGSIHRAAVATRQDVLGRLGRRAGAQRAHAALAGALGAIRKGKTDQKVSVGSEVQSVVYSGDEPKSQSLRLVERDLKAAVRAGVLTLAVGEPGGERHTEAGGG